jgi:hypothetical protein
LCSLPPWASRSASLLTGCRSGFSFRTNKEQLVGMAGRDPHLRAGRNRNHRRAKMAMARARAAASNEASTRMRTPPLSSISMMPEPVLGVDGFPARSKHYRQKTFRSRHQPFGLPRRLAPPAKQKTRRKTVPARNRRDLHSRSPQLRKDRLPLLPRAPAARIQNNRSALFRTMSRHGSRFRS